MTLYFYTHTHSSSAHERERASSHKEEREAIEYHLYTFYVLLLLLVLILSLRKLQGFLLYGFTEENSLCLLSLVIIAVHVILSDKILRSYCLNDKKYNMVSELT